MGREGRGSWSETALANVADSNPVWDRLTFHSWRPYAMKLDLSTLVRIDCTTNPRIPDVAERNTEKK